MKYKFKPGAPVRIIFSHNPIHVGKVVKIIGFHKYGAMGKRQYDITNPISPFTNIVSTFYDEKYLEPAYET